MTELVYCEITNNLYGTDTHFLGQPCQCMSCRKEFDRIKQKNTKAYNSIGTGMEIVHGSETWKPVEGMLMPGRWTRKSVE